MILINFNILIINYSQGLGKTTQMTKIKYNINVETPQSSEIKPFLELYLPI